MQIKLFSLQFGGADAAELYFRGEGAYASDDGSLALKKGGRASFETYFNLFSYAKYRKYCGISQTTMRFSGAGRFTAQFFCRTQTGDPLLIKSAAFENELSETLDFSELPEGGYLYAELRAETDGRIFCASWNAESETVQNVKLGAVICTYKREAFVARNLSEMKAGAERSPALKENLHVFVVDNAGTLDLPADGLYTVVRNKNLGGAGGFTRGITEVCADGSFTHFLLMDDDITFPFETLEKTYALLTLLSPEHASATVGGQMLVYERPAVQHEAGGRFNGETLRSENGKADLRERESLLANERASRADYNAWWYCCMPVSAPERFGLPMPFFIKFDDVEYGLRCTQELILMNGIGVWHQDFAVKRTPSLEYYNQRNKLITNALHFPNSPARNAKHLLRFFYRQLYLLYLKQYDSAEMILRAYGDFLKGCSFLKETDAEALNAELSAVRPQYLTAEQIKERYGVTAEQAPNKRRRRNFLKMLAHTLENFFPGRFYKKQPVLADDTGIAERKVFRRKTVIYFNFATGLGYVCELDTKRRRKLHRRIYATFFRLLFRLHKTNSSYRRHYREVCSEEEWRKKFQ